MQSDISQLSVDCVFADQGPRPVARFRVHLAGGVWHLVAGALGAAAGGQGAPAHAFPFDCHGIALQLLTHFLCSQRPLKAQLQAELAAAADETAAEEIRAAFQAREKALEVRIASLAHSRPLLLPALATFQT